VKFEDQTFQARVERERAMHTEKDVLAESCRLKGRFNHIECYPSRKRLYSEMDGYMNECANKKILDLGCGYGEQSLIYLKRGAMVCGIDISSKHIDHATHAALSSGFSGDSFLFKVMDAHILEFEEKTFDVVSGRALFVECLADNPLLKFFRKMTSDARTIDEKPLSSTRYSNHHPIGPLACRDDVLWVDLRAYCSANIYRATLQSR